MDKNFKYGIASVKFGDKMCIRDSLEIEQTFREQYNINRNDGTVGRLYGFDIYEFANNPLYTTDEMCIRDST